jgi:serine/threonine-protein kinase
VLAEADGDAFLGLTVAGRFVVVGRLGAGSMGNVYRARQEAMGRNVALKILRSDRAFDAQSKTRFQREARAMSLLASPHTVTVFDFGEIPERAPNGDPLPGGGSLFLAMEMLEGESLGQRLKVRRRLRIEDAARFTRHALLSLAEAHDKGIIHRDLKPDNLFLCRTADGEICKVLDFGIAKVVDGTQHGVDALETQAGTVFGTPRYMSPEQAQAKPLDARSDLYSLGVLLYQMVVGHAPFVDDDAVVVMARHIKTAPVAPIDAAPELNIPRPVSNLIMRALAKDVADRPPSARAFIAELEAALDPAAQRLAPATGAGATGEMAAVVREDLETPLRPGDPRRAAARSKRMLIVAGSAVVTLGTGLFLLGVLRPQAVTEEASRNAPAAAEEGAAAQAPEAASAEPPPAEPTATPDAAPSGSAAAAPPASASGTAAATRPPTPPRVTRPKSAPAPSQKKTYVIFE